MKQHMSTILLPFLLDYILGHEVGYGGVCLEGWRLPLGRLKICIIWEGMSLVGSVRTRGLHEASDWASGSVPSISSHWSSDCIADSWMSVMSFSSILSLSLTAANSFNNCWMVGTATSLSVVGRSWRPCFVRLEAGANGPWRQTNSNIKLSLRTF